MDFIRFGAFDIKAGVRKYFPELSNS